MVFLAIDSDTDFTDIKKRQVFSERELSVWGDKHKRALDVTFCDLESYRK